MSEIIHTFYQLNEEEKQELSEKYSGNFDVVKVSDSVNSKKRYYGKMTYANGDIYEGEWKDNVMISTDIPVDLTLTPDPIQ